MKFSNPEAFILFGILAVFVIIAIINYKKKKNLLANFFSSKAFKRLGVRSGGEIDFFKSILITVALAFIILALAGPQWGERYENIDIKGIEIVFLLDTSNSMNAEDLKPNRLEVARQLIINVVDNLDTDYLGLVNFAGAAYTQCPMTVDYDAFKLMVEASTISPSEEQGTDFNDAFQLAERTFRTTKSDRRLMILITDGEDQEKKWTDSIKSIKDLGVVIFTVGIGAANGAPIPVKDKDGNLTGWKKDKKGEIVKSRLDEDTLIRIATMTNGQYFRLTDAAAVDTFIQNLKSYDRKVLRNTLKSSKIKRFQYPLIIGMLLLLIEFILSEKKIAWREKQ